jgi:serine/threonine protein kinase
MPPLRLDRFQRVSERDRWGLGECVDALDTQQRNAPVVLKRLPPVTAEQRGRVEAVVRSLEPLRHSTIVPVEGYGFDGDVPFLVVEPAEGASLRAWIDEHDAALRWPDLAEVRALFDGVCAAVAVAHRMRALAGAPVLHGLLSPESVLLSRGAGAGSWDVCVMDFALSTLPGVAWSPAPTSLMSDPRAPEQLADPEAVSTASDVFSLGVLLASMLVPFAFPVRPKCWAHSVEEHPDAARALLASMRPDLPAVLCDELVKALSLDPRGRHPDADRLRTALRRVTWEPAAELAPPPRFAEAPDARARGRARDRDDSHSKPMMRLPSALLADLGPSPMNLRASVPTQRMFNEGLARPEPVAAPPAEPVDARSFEAPSATTTVDALLAFRHFAREGFADGTAESAAPPAEAEAFDDATGPVAVPQEPELTDDLMLPEAELPEGPPPAPAVAVPPDDLFSGELVAQETVVRRPAARVKPVPARESTRALMLSPAMSGARPADGVLVAGVKLQSLVLKAPPRAPDRHEGTRVGVLAPAAEALAGESDEALAERDSLPGETPSDPWAEGAPPEAQLRPSLAPPEWAVQPRMPTMAPPRAWADLSQPPAPAAPNPWSDSPPTVQMTIPPPGAPPSSRSSPPPSSRSSARVLLVAVTVVGVVAFALGVLAGR